MVSGTDRNHPPVEIVRAELDRPDHAAAVLDLLDAFAREPVSGGRPLPREVRETLIPGLRSHPTTLILLARKDGRFIGAAICFTGFSTFRARPLINIHDLTVLETHRGLGIGRRLLRAVEAEAREMGCCRVTLEVWNENLGARRLYGSEGYRGDGSAGDDGYFFMQKELA